MKATAPPGEIDRRSPIADVYNPAFDVTPAHLIAGIITEKGVIRPVTSKEIQVMLIQNR